MSAFPPFVSAQRLTRQWCRIDLKLTGHLLLQMTYRTRSWSLYNSSRNILYWVNSVNMHSLNKENVFPAKIEIACCSKHMYVLILPGGFYAYRLFRIHVELYLRDILSHFIQCCNLWIQFRRSRVWFIRTDILIKSVHGMPSVSPCNELFSILNEVVNQH